MGEIPRELFVPDEFQHAAYEDRPLSIGFEQTISQPSLVAMMTEALQLNPSSRVLEIGTGSGYQTAILASLASEVFTIEIIPELSRRAATTLKELGFSNVHFRVGDGSLGWAEAAPFSGILVAAAPSVIPPALIEQLAVGGRPIIPVGTEEQELICIERTQQGVLRRALFPVRFVPLIGGSGTPIH